MPWREIFLNRFGPGLFAGVTFGDWLRLLGENRFAVDPPCWIRAIAITGCSISNSMLKRREDAAFGQSIAATTVEPPIFVLGMWRSGTTHLHNLFAVDDRLAFPNLYQVGYPHTFLGTEAAATRLLGFFLPAKRIQDNMKQGLDLPAEDELALAVTTFRSAYLSSVFPRRADYYDRYATFRNVLDRDVEQWQQALLWFAKKLTWKYHKPLVFKSPLHTGRIKLLLDVFPDARFVHIHRDPYAVFQSSRHTFLAARPFFSLQTITLDADERTLLYYRQVFDAFFEERDLIREDRWCEIRYEDLERDPVGEMRKIYEALSLPDFGRVEPAMRDYLASLSGYEKNSYATLAPAMKERIAREWRRCFEAWGYPT
jgi:hypothetical protein